MGFPIKFNWALKIQPPDPLEVGSTYPFEREGNRVYPLNTPIDLIDEKKAPVARIMITEFTNVASKTLGSYTVTKLFSDDEKNTLAEIWKDVP